MTLNEIKDMEKTDITRWAIHLLETIENSKLEKILELCQKNLDKSKKSS